MMRDDTMPDEKTSIAGPRVHIETNSRAECFHSVR